jgi:ribosomal-protein-alanine N-acetyltransferase
MTATTTLHTKRLLLRPFQSGDVDDALAYRDDELFAKFLPHIPQPFTRKDAEAFVARNMSEPWSLFPTFAVVLNGTVIGTTNLSIDEKSRTAMLGYALGRAWWGRGFATEAALAVMEWGFASFALVRMWASTDLRNHQSQRVMQKIGMQREDLRIGEHPGRHGERIEVVVYAMQRSPTSTVQEGSAHT